MLHLDNQAIESLFEYGEFIPILKEYFTKEISSPPRPHYPIANGQDDPNMLLLMPAWQVDHFIGIKIITVFQKNALKHLNTINGVYLLMDGKTGQPVCTFDASTITSKRTAATSALASSFLARKDSSVYTMLGTGRLCLELILAHKAIFNLEEIAVWGRDLNKAESKVSELANNSINATVAGDKSTALSKSDIISAATYSKTPIVLGTDVREGTHIDLVGSYLPDYREADDDLIKKSSVFIDTKAAIHESGDLIIPINQEVIKKSDIQGTLIELCRNEDPGRLDKNEITFFKSVGYALEDLAIGIYLYQKYMENNV